MKILHSIMLLNWYYVCGYPVGLEVDKHFQRKNVNIFLTISLTYVLGAQKNRLIETILLSTQTYVLVEK